ncbi:hypothetical protein [Natrialba swarupiae]|uniref:PhiH1 repressor n=1 Tax=Natrialba swarupiae TaxID=2448032 RepID=A0A5D5AR56_9EURY|nr:hypothetical protein [Natrialba swarupiae]MCW8172536.1 hypothetical protein [Natrialba swarupiae]TYT63503.1 hypothetical protein FYC77_02705 [Natrialba swarupiae]
MSEDTDDWMAPPDEYILEEMQSDDVFSPTHIEEADICRGPDAAYRCRELAKRGLLRKHAPGLYDITDLGERVLEGSVDPDELEAED